MSNSGKNAIPHTSILVSHLIKKHNEALAPGYVVFRLFETMLLSVAEINKLSLVNISQHHLKREFNCLNTSREIKDSEKKCRSIKKILTKIVDIIVINTCSEIKL